MATIYVDVRCLQDNAYRLRGVGQHSVVVLAKARSALADCGAVRLVALTDPRMESLCTEDRALFDAVETTGFIQPNRTDWFLALSPMTHDPLRVARAITRQRARCASIVYDFIPHEHPEQYLQDPVARIDYANNLSWLKQYDLFLAISGHTAQRCCEIIGADPARVINTGVAVRESMIAKSKVVGAQKHFLVVGGGDPRKNPEVAVRAHARFEARHRRAIPLVIAGGYPESMQLALRALHESEGARADLLVFLDKVSDALLSQAYQEAIVTICPSRAEGFSIPVVEANANGSAVLISNCEAQRELIPFDCDQFGPDDADRLSTLLEKAALDPDWLKACLARQADVWRRFTPDGVGQRFWAPIASRMLEDQAKPAMIHRGARAQIAFVTPLPPDRSGVADYSAASLAPLAHLADVHLFTDTVDPLLPPGCVSINALSPMPYLSKRFDSVVSVVGNSELHVSIVEHLLDYGGAAIAHDARMINFYALVFGAQRACAVASRECSREVLLAEVHAWLHDQRKLPVLFLSELVEGASPFITHSRVTQGLVKAHYKADVAYLPFSSYRAIQDDTCNPAARTAARALLGLPETSLVLASFGFVAADKAPEAMVWTLQQLVGWGIDARLALVGEATPIVAGQLRALARHLGIGDRLTLFEASVSEHTYRQYLSAADVGLQLRAYGLGGLSGGLMDCIAAGLPTISNTQLALAMEAPDFVRRTPDDFSPVLMAETILQDMEPRAARPLEARNAYLEARSLESYARGLMALLGFEAR